MEAFYKLVYDISCYYAFVAFFLSYGMEYKVNSLSLLVLLIACYAAVYAEKLLRFSRVVQMGAFVLPVIPFFLETNLWGKLALLLPWAYMIVTILGQNYYIPYRRFKKTYLSIFWIYTVVFFFFVTEDRTKGEVAMVITVPFLVILLVAGVFLLQLLRFHAGSEDKKKLEKYQRRQLVLFMTAALLLTVGNVVELLYVYVLYPFSKLVLGAGTALVVYIISKLDSPMKPPKELGDIGEQKEYIEVLQETIERIEVNLRPIRERMQALSGEPKDLDYTPVYIIIIVLAAIAVLAVLLGSARNKRRPAAIEDEREDCFDEVAVKEVLKKHFVRPEIIIRYYYREFMKKSEAKKHTLESSDTTKDICEKYKVWNNATSEQTAEAEEVTSLYQKTRYSKEKMTKADANRMKTLVKGL